ncbi:hypothetical protein [Neptunomonas phycophila]|uniref:hypothetical protein n=1 Tax=Neptunomonas phycophila TaxID=1572645 RepID=UPI003736A35A
MKNQINQNIKKSMTEDLILMCKITALTFIVGFSLRVGEYTAEQILPTPPITLQIQEAA